MQTHEILKNIITLHSNPHYRVADIFYRKGYRYADSTLNVLNLPEFDGTILKSYLLKCKDVDVPDFYLLSELVDEYKVKKNIPDPRDDEAVIHIRAGDVVVHDWFLTKDHSSELKKFPGIKKCYIVTAFAFQEFIELGWWMYSSEKYAENYRRIEQFLMRIISENEDVEFDVISNKDIDYDFVFMVTAKNFIRDFGGFSDLIEDLRNFRETDIPPEINQTDKRLVQFAKARYGKMEQEEYDTLIRELIRNNEISLAKYLEESYAENAFKKC